jgi:hypothetical protein
MAIKDIVIDLSKYNDNSYQLDNFENSTYIENLQEPIIESLIACGSASVQYAPGAPQSPGGCPITKYSGNDVTLKSTPRDGIGPYTVTFRRGVLTAAIPAGRLTGTGPDGSTGTNPVYNVTENDDVIRTFTLNDLDISTSGGTLTFSVEVNDSCPTTPQSGTSTCIISVGCVAPVCNFVVT